jgi:hypothetical protein
MIKVFLIALAVTLVLADEHPTLKDETGEFFGFVVLFFCFFSFFFFFFFLLPLPSVYLEFLPTVPV